MDYQRFIARDPKVCGGEPVIKGTRVTVRTVLASLAEGAKVEEILEDFPRLKEEEVRAVIAFAAASAEEDPTGPERTGHPVRIKSALSSSPSVGETALHPPVRSQCKSSLDGGCVSGFRASFLTF